MLNHALLGVAAGGGYQMENSLLFRGAQYLTRTPSVVGDQKTFTLSLWVRRNRLGAEQMLFSAGASGERFNLRWFQDGTERLFLADDAGTLALTTTRLWRDPTGFLHLVVAVDTTQETAAERVRVYCNGQRITDWGTATYPPQNTQFSVNNTVPHLIGRNAPTAVFFMEAELAEPTLIDGAALSPDVFGQIDPVTGSWRPKAVSGVDFGTNGFHLGMPWDVADLGGDVSGRGNGWTPVGFSVSDVLSDSPTNVYATLNPLDRGSGTNTNGNLSISAFSDYAGRSTLGASSGKWYFEVSSTFTSRVHVGVCPASSRVSNVNGSPSSRCDEADAWVYDSYSGAIYKPDGSSIAYGNVWTSGADVIGVALDLDAGKIWFSKNGVWQNSGDPVTGANPAATGLSGFLMPFYAGYTEGSLTFDFGQRPFAFAPPDGFQPLCTANLPATTGQTSGTFTGNAAADGPCVFTGAVPETLSINGNAVTWGTHADKLATGFKIRTASSAYNASGANSWVAIYDKKPTVGPKGRASANAQGN